VSDIPMLAVAVLLGAASSVAAGFILRGVERRVRVTKRAKLEKEMNRATEPAAGPDTKVTIEQMLTSPINLVIAPPPVSGVANADKPQLTLTFAAPPLLVSPTIQSSTRESNRDRT